MSQTAVTSNIQISGFALLINDSCNIVLVKSTDQPGAYNSRSGCHLQSITGDVKRVIILQLQTLPTSESTIAISTIAVNSVV